MRTRIAPLHSLVANTRGVLSYIWFTCIASLSPSLSTGRRNTHKTSFDAVVPFRPITGGLCACIQRFSTSVFCTPSTAKASVTQAAKSEGSNVATLFAAWGFLPQGSTLLIACVVRFASRRRASCLTRMVDSSDRHTRRE